MESTDTMKFGQLAVVSCGLGAVLVLAGLCLQYLIVPQLPVESAWSREDAEAHTVASMRYHNQTFDPKISEDELAATAAEYKQMADRLQAAKTNRTNLPKYVQYAGYLCVVAGAVSYVAEKAKSES